MVNYNSKNIAIVAFALMVAGGTLFYACQKDTESTSRNNQTSIDVKKHKSTGNYQQPTHIVNIDTILIVDNVNYPIIGSAVVGNYDGRVYECDVHYSLENLPITAGIGESQPTTGGNEEPPTLHMKATLKEQYDDLISVITLLFDYYIVDVNANPVDNNFSLLIGTHNITYQMLSDLWTGMVEQCDLNEVVDTIGAGILALSREANIDIFDLASKPYVFDYMSKVYSLYNEYSDGDSLSISISDFSEILDVQLYNFLVNLESGMQTDFPIFYNLNEEVQDTIMEIAEELCFASQPPGGGLKGAGMYKLRTNYAQWKFDRGHISQSEFNDRICVAEQKFWKKNGGENGGSIIYYYIDRRCY